jgi:hypothetical protein
MAPPQSPADAPNTRQKHHVKRVGNGSCGVLVQPNAMIGTQHHHKHKQASAHPEHRNAGLCKSLLSIDFGVIENIQAIQANQNKKQEQHHNEGSNVEIFINTSVFVSFDTRNCKSQENEKEHSEKTGQPPQYHNAACAYKSLVVGFPQLPE